jgi:Protein of unknown function (DUF3592)
MDCIAFIVGKNTDPLLFVQLVVAAIAIGGAVFGFLSRWSLKRAAGSWPIAHATVEMQYTINTGSNNFERWTPVLGYHYEVNGESYSGSVSLTSCSSRDNAAAEESGKAWVSEKIIIRYNPNKPEKSAYLEADGAPPGSRSYADQPPSSPTSLSDLFYS